MENLQPYYLCYQRLLLVLHFKQEFVALLLTCAWFGKPLGPCAEVGMAPIFAYRCTLTLQIPCELRAVGIDVVCSSRNIWQWGNQS